MNPFKLIGIDPTLNFNLIESGYQKQLSQANDSDKSSLTEAYKSLRVLEYRYTDFVECGGVIDTSLERLSGLVDENNLGELEVIILLRKREKQYGWDYDSEYSVAKAFRDAILKGNEDAVDLFLKHGVNPSSHVYKPGNNSGFVYSLLYFAAEANNLSIVKKLVDAGADIKPRDEYFKQADDSAIRQAVKLDRTEIVHYLLEKGANPNASVGNHFRPKTLLSKAAKNQNRAIMQDLVSHQSSVNTALSLIGRNYHEIHNDITKTLNYKYSDEKRGEIGTYYGNEEYKKKEREKFDSEKAELEKKLSDLETEYSTSVKILLDFAVGTDITGKLGDEPFEFISNRDVSNLNFIGVSFEGIPATPSMLKKHRCTGVENAFFTFDDLEKLEDPVRKKDILNQLKTMFSQRGELVNEKGIVNIIPLKAAIKINDLTAIKSRLDAGTNPNIGTPSLIVEAAEKGYAEAVSMLINTGKINNKSVVEAIAAAEKNKHEDVKEILSSQVGINECDKEGNTLLHKAAKSGDLDKVKALVEKGADVNIMNKNGQTPLILAIVEHHYFWSEGEEEEVAKYYGRYNSIIRFLLEHDANPNLYKKGLPLVVAVSKNNPDALRLLIDHVEKQDVKIKSWKDDSPLVPWFVPLVADALNKENAIELLTILKEHGADFRQTDENGHSMLFSAVRSLPSAQDVRSSMVSVMRSIEGAEDRVTMDMLLNTQNSLLDSTLKYFKKQYALIKFLVENGADFGIANEDGSTPLHLLVQEKDLTFLKGAYREILDFFIDNGADPLAKDKDGLSVLYYAAKAGDVQAIDYLVEKGADVNEVSGDRGRTPLHIAACAGNPKTCKRLIELGADETKQDNEGLTPTQLSRSAQVNDKKIFTFRDKAAEREFEQKYIDAQRAIDEAVSKRKSLAELIRQQKIRSEIDKVEVQIESDESHTVEPSVKK